ncbi:hypothetical protein M0812_12794 [Anaeramoeba flamelloides]|uniref:B box-type domain-containing protein n=1 Tax=Anaeramoeba flamelloides TaxID=1746091 RepID=A0AAV7ZM15_9EUKA|nr:hypothetical protein M0812_12794 [Anaeramoeba flamelloides]
MTLILEHDFFNDSDSGNEKVLSSNSEKLISSSNQEEEEEENLESSGSDSVELCAQCTVNTAMVFCRSCKKQYCERCDTSLHGSALSHHTRVLLSTWKETDDRKCEIHSSELNFYCPDHWKLLCFKCISMHTKCDVQELDKAVKSVSDDVDGQIHKFRIFNHQLQNRIEYLQSSQDSIETQANYLKDRINRNGQILDSLIKRRLINSQKLIKLRYENELKRIEQFERKKKKFNKNNKKKKNNNTRKENKKNENEKENKKEKKQEKEKEYKKQFQNSLNLMKGFGVELNFRNVYKTLSEINLKSVIDFENTKIKIQKTYQLSEICKIRVKPKFLDKKYFESKQIPIMLSITPQKEANNTLVYQGRKKLLKLSFTFSINFQKKGKYIVKLLWGEKQIGQTRTIQVI